MEWISVKDKMPPIYEVVIAAERLGPLMGYIIHNEARYNGQYWEDAARFSTGMCSWYKLYHDVTHWMPPLQPPSNT